MVTIGQMQVCLHNSHFANILIVIQLVMTWNGSSRTDASLPTQFYIAIKSTLIQFH